MALSTFKKTISRTLALLALAGMTQRASAQAITEDFNNVSTLAGQGWLVVNNSEDPGDFDWFQGSAATFPSFNGPDSAYIASNFEAVDLLGDISNWLISPVRSFKNGDTLSFYTRTVQPDPGDPVYADRLEFRLSTAGNSSNVGTTAASVGDFTTVLANINPSLTSSGYPFAWTKYQVILSGLSGTVSGRVAFRYNVTDGGYFGDNSNYIGIDAFRFSPLVSGTCPTITVAPATLPAGQQGVAYNQTVTGSGGVAPYTYTISAGTLPTGLTLSAAGMISGTATVAGNYTFTVKAADANACNGTRSYSVSITGACPTATSLSYGGNPFCATGSANPTLTAGAGGTYAASAGLSINSSTGVINLGASTPGGYNVSYTIPAAGSCPAASTSFDVLINAIPATPTITQSANTLQSSAPAGNQWFFNGPNSPISGATGQTYAATQSGAYSVQVTLNGCSSAMSAAYNFTPCRTATSLSYGGNPFCATGTANPTLTAGTGGTYSSSAGLAINASTGVINLATSTPGAYNVAYTIAAAGSCPAASTSFDVLVKAIPATPTVTQSANTLQSSAAAGNQWYFNGANNPISGATGQTYAATQSGTYTVQATVNGCSSVMSAAYNFVLNAVPALSIENGFQVGPNPVRSQLRIGYTGTGGRFSVRLLDGGGRQVLPSARFGTSQTIDLSGLAAGTYIVEVYDERSGKRSQQTIQKL